MDRTRQLFVAAVVVTIAIGLLIVWTIFAYPGGQPDPYNSGERQTVGIDVTGIDVISTETDGDRNYRVNGVPMIHGTVRAEMEIRNFTVLVFGADCEVLERKSYGTLTGSEFIRLNHGTLFELSEQPAYLGVSLSGISTNRSILLEMTALEFHSTRTLAASNRTELEKTTYTWDVTNIPSLESLPPDIRRDC